MKDVVLVGLGAVGTHFCKILTLKHTAAEDVRIVGVADSTAAIYLAQGFAPAELLRHKESHSLATYRPEAAVISCDSPLHLLDHPFHILIDATPANLIDGEPGVSCAKRALSKGKAVVCANKAPLVLQWSELHDIARRNEAQLKYSATVCGGLPVVNVGQRDLVYAKITKVEGILNSTSNYVLTEMSRGNEAQAALEEAQARGIAEANAELDLNGTDAACKLVIIANGVLKASPPAKLSEVDITGIEAVGCSSFENLPPHQTIKLVATAHYCNKALKYLLSVQPTRVDKTTLLGSSDGTDMCVTFTTDIFEEISLKTNETGVFPTAAAVLRDVLHIIQTLPQN